MRIAQRWMPHVPAIRWTQHSQTILSEHQKNSEKNWNKKKKRQKKNPQLKGERHRRNIYRHRHNTHSHQSAQKIIDIRVVLYSSCSPYLPLRLPASLFNSFSGCFFDIFSLAACTRGRYRPICKHEYSSLDSLMYSFIQKILLLCVHSNLCEKRMPQKIIWACEARFKTRHSWRSLELFFHRNKKKIAGAVVIILCAITAFAF